MKFLTLNTLVICSVALLGMEAAQAKSMAKTVSGAVASSAAVPKKVASIAQRRARIISPSLVKRGVLLSIGKVDPSIGDISSNLAAGGYANPEVTDTSDARTFAVGYRQPLLRHWSVDVTYIDQGEISTNVTAGPSGTNPAKDVALSLPIYGRGLNYAGLRHFPVMRGVTAHVGAGAFIYTSEREATIDGNKHTEKDSGVKAMTQLGLSFVITPRVNVELTGQRFFMSGDDVDRLSVGVSVSF